MIPTNHVCVKIMMDHAPIIVKQSALVGQMMEMPYILNIFLIPNKNEASKHCPIANKAHESNNIYFQFLFPVMTHKVPDMPGKYITWTAHVLEMLSRGTMQDFARLGGWPIMVRCFRDACTKKCAFYTVEWSHVMQLIEPMASRMLNDNNYHFNAHLKTFELAKVI